MTKGRLEAFSDAVMAIIITIMVLDMKAPQDTSLKSLLPIIPIFISYLLSFVYIGIYWINHHYIFQVTEKINPKILWANLHLLFWLSLIPFTTSWVGENHLSAVPIAFYGGILLMCAISYKILEISLVKYNNQITNLKNIIKSVKKEKLSILIYIISIPIAFVNIFISISFYFLIAILWVIPNRRIGNIIKKSYD